MDSCTPHTIKAPFSISLLLSKSQEKILCNVNSNKVHASSGGVVANTCIIRSSIVAFRVADPGFKSRPEQQLLLSCSLAYTRYLINFVKALIFSVFQEIKGKSAAE